METASSLEEGERAAKSLLSESKMMVLDQRKAAHHCKGCALYKADLTPTHCCRLCAKTPGEHGPYCRKTMIPCSSPGCGCATTGIVPGSCCRKCAVRPGEHGPRCRRVPYAVGRLATAGRDSVDDGDGECYSSGEYDSEDSYAADGDEGSHAAAELADGAHESAEPTDEGTSTDPARCGAYGLGKLYATLHAAQTQLDESAEVVEQEQPPDPRLEVKLRENEHLIAKQTALIEQLYQRIRALGS